MLFFRILKIALTLTFIINGFVNGSLFWRITNQMKVEQRPYTQTPSDPSTTGPTYISEFDKLLEPNFRAMHQYCDGQCFYAPHGCASTNSFQDCEVSASVAAHNPDKGGDLYCDFFGSDNLKKSFCSKSEAQEEYRKKNHNNYDRFYTITLHRTVSTSAKNLTCFEKWNVETGRKCRRSEFVGISFMNATSENDLDPNDLWYICVIDETHQSRISMWTNVNNSNSPVQRILGTKPHLESGAGVVFSKVVFDQDSSSMGCQFAIQESNMSMLVNPPNNSAFFKYTKGIPGNPIRLKLATGIVERDKVDDKVLRPFYDNNISHFQPKVFHGSNIKPTDQIFFDAINVELEKDDFAKILQDEEEHTKVFKELISKCDKPSNFPNIYIVCYPPNLQQNCVHTGRCPVMFIVEIPRSDTSFDTIKAYLYSLLPDYKSLRKVNRPQGYASVAFSFDAAMGRDLVITCHANGPSNISVLVSINFENNNLYPGKVDYNSLIYNTKTYRTISKVNHILCSWEMKTKLFVNMFDYEPDYMRIIHPGQSEKLEYDFKLHEYFLLLAAGNRNYPDGSIVFHDFRQVLTSKFSREEFLKIAKGNRNKPHFAVFFITLALSFVPIIF